jgi:predicted metal-binding protein
MVAHDKKWFDREMGQLTTTKQKLDELLSKARDMGATDAVVLAPENIVVEDSLAEKCIRPKCINYGLSKSCPPNVGGPGAMRKRLETVDFAIFFKIEVPSAILYSGQGRELFQLLHETAAGIEHKAVALGFANARAYAGNSCKKVFCRDFLECRVIGENGQCRNPDRARQSMSGFGINVTKLYEAAGWPFKGVTHENGEEVVGMSSICGLVLL